MMYHSLYDQWYEMQGTHSEREHRSVGAVAHDFNGDGKVDIYVINQGDTNELLLNGWNGQFSRASSVGDLYVDGEDTFIVTAADFDSDGSIE